MKNLPYVLWMLLYWPLLRISEYFYRLTHPSEVVVNPNNTIDTASVFVAVIFLVFYLLIGHSLYEINGQKNKEE